MYLKFLGGGFQLFRIFPNNKEFDLWVLLTYLIFCYFLHFQAKMGFREGEGLGKFNQGRKEIVEASTQRGRRGLGLTLQGFQGELNVDWRDEPEVGSSPFWHLCFLIFRFEIIYVNDQLTVTWSLFCLFSCLSAQPSAVEKVDWFPECTTEIPDADELRDWMIQGPVKPETQILTYRYACIAFAVYLYNSWFSLWTEKT